MDLEGFDPLSMFEAAPDQQFRTIEMTMNGVTKKIVIPITSGASISKPTTPPVQSPSIDSTQVKLNKTPAPVMSIQPIKIEPDDEEDADMCEITNVTSLRPFMDPKNVDLRAGDKRPRKTGLLPNTVGHRVPNILRSGPGDRLVPHVAPQQTKRGHSITISSKNTTQKRSVAAGPFRSRGGNLKTGHTPISIKPTECNTNSSGQKTNVARAQGDTGTSTPSPALKDNPPTVLNMKRMMDPNLLQSIVQSLADKNMLLPATKLVISGDSITVTNSAPLSSVQTNKQAEFKIVVQNASQPPMSLNAGLSVAKTDCKPMLASDTKTAGNFVQVANVLGSPKPALDNIRWNIPAPQTPMPINTQYIQSTLPTTMTSVTNIQPPPQTANIQGKPCVVHHPGTVITSPSLPVFLNNSINTMTPSIVSHVQQTPLVSPPQQPLQAIISADGKLTLQPTIIAPQTTLQTRMVAPQTTLQTRMVAPQTTLQTRMVAPQTTLQTGMLAPQTTLQTRMVAPQTTLQTGMVAPQTALQTRMVAPQTTVPGTGTFLNTIQTQTQIAQLVNGNIVVPAPNVVNSASTPSVTQLSTIRPLYMLPMQGPAGAVNTMTTRMSVPASTKGNNVPAMQLTNGKLEFVQQVQTSTASPKNEPNVCVQATRSQNGSIVIREFDPPSKIFSPNQYQSTVNTQIVKPPTTFPMVANHMHNSKPKKMDLGPIILNGQSLGTLIQQNTVKKVTPKIPKPSVAEKKTFLDTGLVNIAPKPGSSSNLLQKLAEAISGLNEDSKDKNPEENRIGTRAEKQPTASPSPPASESATSLDDGMVSVDSSIERVYTQQYRTLEDRWAELFGGKLQTKRDETVRECFVALKKLDMQGKTTINIRDVEKVTTRQSAVKGRQSKKREIELLSDYSSSSETDDDTEEDDYFEALRKEKLRKRQQSRKMAFYQKFRKHRPEFE